MIHPFADEYPLVPVPRKAENNYVITWNKEEAIEILPIGKDVSGPGWLINEPGGVDEDFDQSQSSRDGQLRSRADVFGAWAGQRR